MLVNFHFKNQYRNKYRRINFAEKKKKKQSKTYFILFVLLIVPIYDFSHQKWPKLHLRSSCSVTYEFWRENSNAFA